MVKSKGTRVGRRALLASAAALFLLGGAPAVDASGAATNSAAPIPGTSCAVFPSDNIWNADISGLPVNPNSAAWLATMQSSSTNLHPDFGRPPYGMPFAVVDNSYPT